MPPKGRGNQYRLLPRTGPVAGPDVSDSESYNEDYDESDSIDGDIEDSGCCIRRCLKPWNCSHEESSNEDSDESDSIDGVIRGSNYCKCSCKYLKRPWNCLRSFFNGYIPNNLYTIDFKLLFILTAMYTSLVTQFRQAASQQADDDVDSGKLFRINSIWPNNSISGGVSDRVLWNCRSDSKTSTYYKTLYLGLITLYGTVVIVYLLASVIINSMVACAVSKLKINMKDNRKSTQTNARESYRTERNTKTYLELVAKEVKIAYRARKKLRKLERKLFSLHSKGMLKNKISELNESYNKLLQFKSNSYFYNWFTLLYIIPRFQTVLMLCVLTLTLTSYDIHPIGCLSNISISYNETEASVTLIISENSIIYKKICILLIILLAAILFILKVFQYSLLPRSKRVKKSNQRNVAAVVHE